MKWKMLSVTLFSRPDNHDALLFDIERIVPGIVFLTIVEVC